MKKMLYKLLVLLIAGISLTACGGVKAYQKAKLNDKEMILAPKLSARFEMQFHTYREGAAGANGGKTGGGCGCN